MAITESPEQLLKRKQQERALLDYPFTAPAADGSALELVPGVFWVRMPMPMALDHINVYLLDDGDGWYLVDTGLNTGKSREIWQLLAQRYFNGRPVKGVICTHFHYDHAGLAGWLMEHFQAPLYMTYGEYYTLRAMASSHGTMGNEGQQRFYRGCGIPAEQMAQMFQACQKDPFMADYPPSFNRLRQGDSLTIGGRRWQILIGEGHSPEHACLYCAADELLIAGDQLLPEISSNVLVSDVEPGADPLSLWLASLDRLTGLAPQTLVLPSHGPVFRNLHNRIEQLQEHHRRQLELLRQRARGVSDFSAYDALGWLFDRKLSPIELMLAMGETLAHLNWLLESNQLQAESCAAVVRYSLVDKAEAP